MSKNPHYRKTRRYSRTNLCTIDQAREIVLQTKKLEGLSKHTLVNYEKLFNDFDRFFGEDSIIAELSIADAKAFMEWQLNKKVQFLKQKYRKVEVKGVSVSSANTYLNYGKAAFTVLIEEHIVTENIFEDINNIKQKQQKVDTLSINEIRQLFNAMDKSTYSDFRTYVICHLLLDSFGRITETLSLCKSDVDFNTRIVTFTQTKNGRLRSVPISRKTARLLRELIAETEDFVDTEKIFVSNYGTELRTDTFRKHLRLIAKRANIKKRVHPHLFRHTASEMFISNGGNVRVLQKILGHSDLVTTSRYAHVLDNTIVNQHEQYSPILTIEESTRRKIKRSKIQ